MYKPVSWQKIEKLTGQGVREDEIAERLGCSRSAVKYVVTELGLDGRL